jgi:predicted transcriptional regulator with HTH domain
MGTKGSGYPKWTPGKEMPLFSGKSWKELEDIWPRDLRLSSEAWKIVSVMAPAWLATTKFMKSNYGEAINMRDFFYLCWIHRGEDAKENVATVSWPIMKGLNIGGKLWYKKKSALTRIGLIENIPSKWVRLYRVTATGKMVIRVFIENVEKAHKDIRMWKVDSGPGRDETNERITRYFSELQKESPE